MNLIKRVISLLAAVASMLLIATIHGEKVTSDDLIDIFKSANLTPHVISYAPYDVLYVKYPEKEIDYGNSLHVLDTLMEPTVAWNDTDEEADPNSLYTLMFVNVDRGEPNYLHWMVNNIYGDNMTNAQVTIKYEYPDPPDGLKAFRMVFLVYRQPSLEPYQYNARVILGHAVDRTKFDLYDFLLSYNFTEFPVAGNYFVQWPRINNWHPLDPPGWMIPFLPELKKRQHPIGK